MSRPMHVAELNGELGHPVAAQIEGQITCQGVSHSRALYAFTRKKIEKWMKESLFTGFSKLPPGPVPPTVGEIKPTFDVVFKREGLGHAVTCRLEIMYGSVRLVASRYGRDLNEALNSCLRYLAELPPALSSLSLSADPVPVPA